MISKGKLSKMVSAIIDRLESERTEQGLSMKLLSEKSGVSMQYLYGVFRREHSPSLDVLCKVAEALGLQLMVDDSRVGAKSS